MKTLLFLCFLVSVAFAKPPTIQFKSNTKSQNGFIVGGAKAVNGDAPHQVSLQHTSHFCGKLLKFGALHKFILLLF